MPELLGLNSKPRSRARPMTARRAASDAAARAPGASAGWGSGSAAWGTGHGRCRRLAVWLRALAGLAVVAGLGGRFLPGREAGDKCWLELAAERVVAVGSFDAARMLVAQAAVLARAVWAVA